MLTIHCFVCGKDESLPGVPGGSPSPLERFQELHPHSKGAGRVDITCPCGEQFLIRVGIEVDTPAFRAEVQRAKDWSLVHQSHMQAADRDEEWTQWIN